MKYFIKNKAWEINKEYDKEKLLYLLIDRPDEITKHSSYVWKNNKNQLHRDYDFPTYIWNTGDVWWYKNDTCHRENNKPALICIDGYEEYWLNDKFVK